MAGPHHFDQVRFNVLTCGQYFHVRRCREQLTKLLILSRLVTHFSRPDKESLVPDAGDCDVLHVNAGSRIQVLEGRLQGSLNQVKVLWQSVFYEDFSCRPAGSMRDVDRPKLASHARVKMPYPVPTLKTEREIVTLQP